MSPGYATRLSALPRWSMAWRAIRSFSLRARWRRWRSWRRSSVLRAAGASACSPHSRACARGRDGNGNSTDNGKLAVDAPPVRPSPPLLSPQLPLLLRPSMCLSSRWPGHCSTRSLRRRRRLLPCAPCLCLLWRERHPHRLVEQRNRPCSGPRSAGISTPGKRITLRPRRWRWRRELEQGQGEAAAN